MKLVLWGAGVLGLALLVIGVVLARTDGGDGPGRLSAPTLAGVGFALLGGGIALIVTVIALAATYGPISAQLRRLDHMHPQRAYFAARMRAANLDRAATEIAEGWPSLRGVVIVGSDLEGLVVHESRRGCEFVRIPWGNVANVLEEELALPPVARCVTVVTRGESSRLSFAPLDPKLLMFRFASASVVSQTASRLVRLL